MVSAEIGATAFQCLRTSYLPVTGQRSLRVASAVSRAAEPAGASRGGGEILDHFEGHLYHRNDDHLRDTIAGVDGEGLRAAIPHRHHQGALIVGVDQADQIPQYDAVL